MGRLDNKVAIVTGGARGIGAAVARRFVAEGARVVLSDIQEAGGQALAAELGEAARFFRADAASLDDWSRLVAQTIEWFGSVDILVNNAGGGMAPRAITAEDEALHRSVLDVNLTGTWAGMRAVVSAMQGRGGSIVNISSIDGLVGVSQLASYVAAKFAVTGLTRAMAMEFGPHNIRVNSVHPGVIATELVTSAGPTVQDRIAHSLRHQPIPRMGQPHEIASAVLFFASDESAYCTGSGLVVDGGHIAGPAREPMPD